MSSRPRVTALYETIMSCLRGLSVKGIIGRQLIPRKKRRQSNPIPPGLWAPSERRRAFSYDFSPTASTLASIYVKRYVYILYTRCSQCGLDLRPSRNQTQKSRHTKLKLFDYERSHFTYHEIKQTL